MNKYLNKFKELLNRVFKSDDTKFVIFTGLKVSSISLLINIIIYTCLFEVMRLNYVFFRSQGFPDFQDDQVFFNYIMSEAMENLPVLFLFHIFLFFIGTYVGWLILRPFRMIGDYCDEVIENPEAIYKVDEFSTYKLLTRFSEFFFEFLRDSRNKKQLSINTIPPQFSKIHQPVPDRVFMLHFGLLLVIVAISSSVFIIENGSAVFHSMIELAAKTLPTSKDANRFLNAQDFVMDDLISLTVFLITTLYLGLGVHLYGKVSGAAFGIFSTMRSFMKGDHFSRVHLVGYAHIRDNTRKLNKYLDFVQNNFEKRKPKG
jgi:hypothetical protein